MGWEHEPETVWRAQELYCVDRLSFDKVAESTGVAASTLKRWAYIYAWREKREEIAHAEADIRADKVLARSKMLKALLEKQDAQTSFAVASLESLALKEAEAARLGITLQQAQQDAAVSVAVSRPEDVTKILRQAVEQKLGLLLSRPENIDLKAVQEVQKTLALISDMEAAQPKNKPIGKGMTAELINKIEAAMRGDIE